MCSLHDLSWLLISLIDFPSSIIMLPKYLKWSTWIISLFSNDICIDGTFFLQHTKVLVLAIFILRLYSLNVKFTTFNAACKSSSDVVRTIIPSAKQSNYSNNICAKKKTKTKTYTEVLEPFQNK